MEYTHRRKKNKPVRFIQGNKDNAVVVEADRISQLPEPIAHHIMSTLPTKYAIRTSALSKKWKFIWSRFPVLDLNEVNLLAPNRSMTQETLLECRHSFAEYLQQTLLHHCMVHLEKLRIFTLLPGTDEIFDLVDGFMDAAMKGHLKILDLKFSNKLHPIFFGERGCLFCYKLPEVIFSFGSSLVSLSVEGCKFVEYENLVVSFPLLKILSIENSHIEGSYLERIISGCRELESICLRSCHGLKSASIYNGNVRHFLLDFGSCGQLTDFGITFPNLHSCRYKGRYLPNENGGFELPTSVALNDLPLFSCLNTLTLVCLNMKAGPFNRLLSGLKSLKIVETKKCWIIGKVIVSGENLTSLVIEDCYLEETIEIEDCSLYIFNYINNDKTFNLKKKGFQNLRDLSIVLNNELTCEDLEFVVSSSPLLVTLILKSCPQIEHIKILSSSLDFLLVEDCSNIKEVTILAPKLEAFKYTGPASKFSQLSTSYTLTALLHLEEPPQDHNTITDVQLLNVREFLQRFSCYGESMILVCECAEYKSMRNDRQVPPPVDNSIFFEVTTRCIGMNNTDLLQRVLSVSSCIKTLCVDLETSSILMKLQDFVRELIFL